MHKLCTNQSKHVKQFEQHLPGPKPIGVSKHFCNLLPATCKGSIGFPEAWCHHLCSMRNFCSWAEIRSQIPIPNFNLHSRLEQHSSINDNFIYFTLHIHINIYIHIELRTTLPVWGKCHHQDAPVPFDSKCRKIFECALVHLGYTYYRHLWKHEPCGWNYETWTKRRIALSSAHNKDSKPWTLSCGQSLFFPSLVCKNSFNMKEWLSHVFTTAGLGQLNLFSSTLGWSDRGSKWYKLSIGWYRSGYWWVLPISFKNMRKKGSSMHERCERHPKRQTKKKENEALSETDGLCSSEHRLRGIGFGGSPIAYAGFMSCFKVQGNFLLLCSSNNFVGYPHDIQVLLCQLPFWPRAETWAWCRRLSDAESPCPGWVGPQ